MSDQEYEVTWSIQVGAPNPEVAAMDAFEMMRDPASIATIVVVRPAGQELPDYVFDMADPNKPEPVVTHKEERMTNDDDDLEVR